VKLKAMTYVNRLTWRKYVSKHHLCKAVQHMWCGSSTCATQLCSNKQSIVAQEKVYSKSGWQRFVKMVTNRVSLGRFENKPHRSSASVGHAGDASIAYSVSVP
jgi:acyl-CoA reductase-like NAD-dependent aldehyde dehydrogenase